MKFETAMILPFLHGSEFGPSTKWGRQPIHLQQSELDGACGQHCLFMALLALGVVQRDDLSDLEEAEGELGKVWKKARKSFFDGTFSTDIIRILSPFKNKINYYNISKRNNALRDQIILDLQSNNMVMLILRNVSHAHWVLVVGMQGLLEFNSPSINEPCRYEKSCFNPDTFLLLDPSSAPLPFLSWNAVLEVNSTRSGYRNVEYISGKHSQKYKIDAAVSIGKK